VHVQVAFLCEFVPTELTLIRLNAKMLPDVNLESRFLGVTNPANIAFKGFFIGVVELMRLEMPFSQE
jgi:hypothetical protein